MYLFVISFLINVNGSTLIALIGAILLAWKGGNLFQVAIVSCALVFIVELIIV